MIPAYKPSGTEIKVFHNTQQYKVIRKAPETK